MEASYGTDILYAGRQSNEIATAHRHVVFALSFIIERSRGFNAAELQKISMESGNVIWTPSWNLHDRRHERRVPRFGLMRWIYPCTERFQ